MLVDLSLEEMDYIIDLVKGGNPDPLKQSVALKMAMAIIDSPNEPLRTAMCNVVEKYAEKTAAPDPD